MPKPAKGRKSDAKARRACNSSDPREDISSLLENETRRGKKLPGRRPALRKDASPNHGASGVPVMFMILISSALELNRVPGSKVMSWLATLGIRVWPAPMTAA